MKYLLSILLSFAFFAAFAQDSASASDKKATEGKIDYEVTINMHRRIPKEREAMKANIPEFRTDKFELFFRNDESLFVPVEEEEEEADADMSNRRRFRFRMAAEVYQNTTTAVRIEMREFMGKKFLISDTVRVPAWKFEEETKEIMGYTCKKATLVIEGTGQGMQGSQSMQVTAWYSEKLISPIGPDMLHSLPGTILEADANNGEIITKVTKIDLRTLKKNEMKVPNEGKKVTRDEFREMMKEAMKNMGGGGFGGGR